MIQILKVIVGSQAHGLANEKSDFDYRGVFVVPTTEILSLGGHKTNTSWIEGKDDDTSWEIGHFLNLAVHCNPTILETFLAPTVPTERPNWGDEMQQLFPYIWNSKDVANAFTGYGFNQRKKFLENKDNRRAKYAVAYLRTLYQAKELLTTGTFTINFKDTRIFDTLKKWKAGQFEIGEVIEVCENWREQVQDAYLENSIKEANLEPVNEFLLKVRKEFWQ